MQSLISAMSKVRQALYTAFIRSLLRTKSLLQTILNIWLSPSIFKKDNVTAENGTAESKKTLAAFLREVEDEFQESKKVSELAVLSSGLREQFQKSLFDNQLCMLPSYNHQLPHGGEQGTYLALDVGGSTFRIALIELYGAEREGNKSTILRTNKFTITNDVKQLQGLLFFDWMAKRIGETLLGQDEGRYSTKEPLSMGMSWSFPIE